MLIVGIGGLSRSLGSNTNNNLDLPGTDSQQATDLLAERFPPQQNGKSPIVFSAGSGKVTDADNKEAIQDSYKAIGQLPHVASVTSPFSQTGAGQISKDEQTAFIPVLMDVGSGDLTQPLAQKVVDAAQPAVKAGMQVAAGGPIGDELSEPATESSEVIGLIAAMVILAITFGTLVAMGLPILSAIFGLVVGISLIGLLGHLVSVPTIAPTVATMIGLGVGIDYALFLVSRHRMELAQGKGVHESIATAVSTSGTAIVFAGGTVVIAMVTLLVAGIPLVTSLGYASALAVVTAVLAAITLLPAILSLLGKGINSVRLPAFLHPKPKPPGQGFWAGWARMVTTHPWRAVALSLAILLPLMVPFFSLQLGQEDIGATPKEETQRQAYDLMAKGFGPGYNGPLLVAVKLGKPATPSSEFESNKKEAQDLQTQLTAEQSDLEAQAAQLQAQAASLSAQQAALEQQAVALKSQEAALGTEANALSREKGQLQVSRRKLEQERTIVRQLRRLLGDAASLLRQEASLARQESAIARQLKRNRVRQAAVRARLRQLQTPLERARLEARLDRLERRERKKRQQLAAVHGQQENVREQAQALASRSVGIRKDAAKVARDSIELVTEAVATAQQALALAQAKILLTQEGATAQIQAAQLQTQAAELETQKVELQAQQEQAQEQAQQAQALKTQLTAQLTQAGGDERGTDPRLVALQDDLVATVGVKLVSPPQINKKGDATIFTVIAKAAPAAEETSELVNTIRRYVIPQATHGTDLDTHVGGQTAAYNDLAAGISAKLGLVIFAVIGLGFLLLMMAFRSVLVPAQAALANVLCVLAAFGVITAVFQWGWGLSLVGLETSSGTDPIASFVPLIMFALLFGLSMDYQVFLTSQIEHHRAEHESDRDAIAAGLASGAPVISAAALIMISVFSSFILNGDPTVKQFGVGLSVGVALAAMSVLLLAPALLVLAGKGSWWVPQWADRFLPRIDIEGEGATDDTQPT